MAYLMMWATHTKQSLTEIEYRQILKVSHLWWDGASQPAVS
jgi:hypothetical protein